MNFDYQICSVDHCTGCFACMNKCPTGAIKYKIDERGCTIPIIVYKMCIQCGLCVKTCPENYPAELKKPMVCYAAQRSNPEIREKSTSGGIAAALAERFLDLGGCVFGAAATEGGEISHICAETIEAADRLRGSKYVQSYIGSTYRNVKDKLNDGKMALFTGTPCQIAGLKKYLGKNYENLYCVDLICHGVPPMQYLREHYRKVTNGAVIDSVSFRNPKAGFFLSLKSGKNIVYQSDRFHDTYFYAFFHALTYRENCYQCRYAGENRCSDMTIGDFWGINRKTLRKIDSGYISVILINSVQGERLFDLVKELITFEEREISEAIRGNKQLQVPSKKHRLRDKFIEAYYLTKDFNQAAAAIKLTNEMKREAVIGQYERIKGKIVWKLNSILGDR